MSLDPIAFGRAAARVTLAQDARTLRVLPGGHVHHLRPSQVQATLAGHPSALPAPYDHTADPDRPVLPSLVVLALDRIGQFVRVPGCDISRAQAIEALDVVGRWARPDLHADDAPVHGIPRPGGVA